MKLYNNLTSYKGNLNEGTYNSLEEVKKTLGVSYTDNKRFKKALACICDYRLIGNSNKKKVDILEVYETPLPYYHGDYSKLKCTEEERQQGGIYVIQSKEYDKYYIGSTHSLKKRFSNWKCLAKGGSKETGAEVLRYDDSLMQPLFIANDNCTREQLYHIEDNMIKCFKTVKSERCLNAKWVERLQQSVEGIGTINWDLLCDLHVFNRTYEPIMR